MSICPGCGLELPRADGPTHPYIGASPECWALYGQVLARAYEERDPELQLVVDAYACQHPGSPSRRARQSVALHLTTLCLFLEAGADPRRGSELHQRMVGRIRFRWLEPPPDRGKLTVVDADDTWTWARSVWRAWEPHHATVREWAKPWRTERRGAAPG